MIKNNTLMRRIMVVLMAVVIAAAYSGITGSGAYAASKITVKSAKTINAGRTIKMTANKKAKWSVVKGKSVAKITSRKSGKTIKVKALKSGKAVVKAKAGSKSNKITLTVIPALKISPSSAAVETGKTVQLKANNSVKWSVSNAEIAEITGKTSKTATVKGLKKGSAVVKVKDAKTGYSKSVKVTVNDFVPETASVDEVSEMMFDDDDNTALVDARPQEAYAGWALQGAKHGGHLKGADLYSARWLDCDYSSGESARDKKLEKYNKEFGLDPDKKYIVYDYASTNNEAYKVAQYFHKQGVKNVKIFDAKSLIDAGSNLDSYKNYDMFMPAEMVKDISDYKTGKDKTLDPETTKVIKESDMDKVVLIDVSYGNVHESNYLTDGHVPGAIHMNTNCYERPRNYVPEKKEKYALEYSLIPLDEFRDDLCTEYGITKDSIVIAASSDGAPIARFGYMLRSLGVKYYGMAGHYTAWKYNGYELDKTNIEEPTSVDSFGSKDIANPDEIVWIDDVKKMMKANHKDPDDHTAGTLVGKDHHGSTYSYHDLIGEVPGGFIPEDLIDFENIDGTPTQRELILASYKANGIPTDKPIVHYCGDGWGAAQEAYDAQQDDITNVKYWGQGNVVWTNQGNWFKAYNGQLYKYDKYTDTIVDAEGDAITNSKIMKTE